MHRRTNESGFTLVEMAMVLVVVGLVLGGVVMGGNLLRAAELRTISEQYIQITTAVKAFTVKYGSLPGDLPNATQIWGRADGGADLSVNCASTGNDIDATNPKATCNGNGDGRINDGFGATDREFFRFWQHLSNAELLPEQYSGVSGPAGTKDPITGENVMAGPMDSTGWWTEFYQDDGMINISSDLFHGYYGNFLSIRLLNNNARRAFLTPQEAYQVDLKVDDGKPGRGLIIVGYINECTNAIDEDDRDNAEYLTTDDGDKNCYLNAPDAY